MAKDYFKEFAKLAASKDSIRKKQAKADEERKKIDEKRDEWEADLPEKTRRLREANKRREARGFKDGGICKKTEAKKAALRKLMGK